MLRQDVLSDIESTLGIVPGFMDGMPNMVLEHTWAFLKDFLKVDTVLSAKNKTIDWHRSCVERQRKCRRYADVLHPSACAKPSDFL